jgi:hypothetical protein
LCNKVNAIYENERNLLQSALPKENVQIVAQQGRHYFCSLASYALVPILENHTERKQDTQLISEDYETNTRWWKRLIKFFSNNKVRANVQSKSVVLDVMNESKESENQLNMRSNSILLPHLQMGLRGSISSTSFSTNQDQAKANNEDVEDIEQKKNSLLLENYSRSNENEKDAIKIEQKRDSLLPLTNGNGK